MANTENRRTEIVKKIENPRRDIEEVEVEEEEIVYMHEPVHIPKEECIVEEIKPPRKKILPMILGVTTIGVIGFLGFNFLDKGNINSTPNNVANINSIKSEPTEVKVENKEVKPYIEELAKKNKEIEESVIATLSQHQIESQKKLEIEKHPEKIEKKETIPLKEDIIEKEITALKEDIIKKEESIKQEMISQKEEIVKPEIIAPKKVEKITPKVEVVKQKVTVPKRVVVTQKKVIPKKKNRLKVQYEPIKPRIYKVRKGDSLLSIANRFYGNPKEYKRIIYANSRLKSKKTSLRFEEKIIIPRKDGKKRRRFVIVEKGNTLASISKKIYGSRDKISTIVRANSKIRSRRSTLHLGQKVYVPR